MSEPQERTPGPDDTAAFQRFYGADGSGDQERRGLLYRLFVGWWRDRS
ncbi:MAG TPA: hypothetical protein VG435_01870 [Acidimicrobiales bacterium]|nr:hypothetical protein [Acidimicrobiales bacterium]